MAQQPQVGQALLIIKDSRSHSDTPYSVGLLWTSDQPYAETSTWRQKTDFHASAGFEPTIPASERLQTHALDRSTTWSADVVILHLNVFSRVRIYSAKLPLAS
jgi:hypothetical protein